MHKINPTKIIHLAGLSFVGHNNISDFYINNIIGTRNILQSATISCNHMEHIIFASSANVYGNRHVGQLNEQTSPFPINDYGISKLAAEHICAMFSAKLPITITRPFNYTGVAQSIEMLIPKIVAHVRRKAQFIELGNINVARDFSDVRYVAEIYARLIDCENAVGETVNICSGRAYSLRDILELASSIGDHSPEIRVNQSLVRESEVEALWGSKEFLTDLIGPIDMPQLSETIQWMMENDA
jgi:nucleoside-diphosphate-sugar epimerase